MKKYVMVLLFSVFFSLFTHHCIAESLKIATTTSVENSGLLDVLLPAFEEKFRIKVYAIAVGSAQALKLAENGDVDMVLVHSPQLEKKFMEKGFGIDRKTVFYNDFVIVGPRHDPAHIENCEKVSGAFQAIAQKKCAFVSRGDGSGTHEKELEIWNQIDFSPQGSWYIETGQGMGTTLLIADEKKGYCLVDRGTFFSFEDMIDLVILHEGDSILKNIYSAIAVNPTIFSQTKYRESKLFIDWIGSQEGKVIIDGFKRKGNALFHTVD